MKRQRHRKRQRKKRPTAEAEAEEKEEEDTEPAVADEEGTVAKEEEKPEAAGEESAQASQLGAFHHQIHRGERWADQGRPGPAQHGAAEAAVQHLIVHPGVDRRRVIRVIIVTVAQFMPRSVERRMSDTLASALIAMVVSGTAIAACTRTPLTTRTMRTLRTPRVRGGAGSSTGDSQMSTRDRIIALRDKLRAESRDLDTERELTAIAESISPTPPDYEARDLEDAALLGAPPDPAAAYHRETAVSTHEHARQRANHYDELARKAANPSHPDHVSAKQQTMYPHFAAEHKHARHDLAFREDDLERMEGRSEKRMRGSGACGRERRSEKAHRLELPHAPGSEAVDTNIQPEDRGGRARARSFGGRGPKSRRSGPDDVAA